MTDSSDHDELHARELEGYDLTQLDELPLHLQRWIATSIGSEALQKQSSQDNRVRRALLGDARLSDTEVLEILSRLRDATLVPEASNTNRASDDFNARPAMEKRWSRRAWAAAVAGGLVTVSGTVAAWYRWRESPATGRQGVAQSSLRWERMATRSSWQVLNPQVLASAPIPDEVDGTPRRWTIVKTEWDPSTVLYDLGGPPGRCAWLFVVSSDQQFDVSDRFSAVPDYGTGQHCVGAMLRNRRLYVLLVEGDAASFRQRLRRLGPVG